MGFLSDMNGNFYTDGGTNFIMVLGVIPVAGGGAGYAANLLILGVL